MKLKTVKLQGKDFVLFPSLLEVAHSKGLKRITTKIEQFPSEENNHTVIVSAEVEVEAGTFTGIGDASPASVSRNVAPHSIRMAETRAVGRALRFACNIGLTMREEMGGDSDTNGDQYPPYEKKADVLKMVLALEDEVFDSEGLRDTARHGDLDGKLPGDATQKKLLEYRDCLLRQLIMQREEEVYKAKPAWENARKKWLGGLDIHKAPTEKLQAYSKHMRGKLKEKGEE